MQLILGLAVVIAIILLIGWLQDNKERRRVTSLREAAERLGFDFRQDEDAAVLRQTVPFLIFYQGVSSTAHNVMLSPPNPTDDEAPRIAAFEYAFNVPFGRYTQSWRQTVIQLLSPTLSLPAFSVMPNVVFEALATKARDEKVREHALSSPTLKLDNAPTLTEESHIQAPDRAAVEPLFTNALIRFFEDHPDLCVEAGDNTLILYRFDELTPADKLSAFIDEAYELHRILKEGSA